MLRRTLAPAASPPTSMTAVERPRFPPSSSAGGPGATLGAAPNASLTPRAESACSASRLRNMGLKMSRSIRVTGRRPTSASRRAQRMANSLLPEPNPPMSTVSGREKASIHAWQRTHRLTAPPPVVASYPGSMPRVKSASTARVGSRTGCQGCQALEPQHVVPLVPPPNAIATFAPCTPRDRGARRGAKASRRRGRPGVEILVRGDGVVPSSRRAGRGVADVAGVDASGPRRHRRRRVPRARRRRRRVGHVERIELPENAGRGAPASSNTSCRYGRRRRSGHPHRPVEKGAGRWGGESGKVARNNAGLGRIVPSSPSSRPCPSGAPRKTAPHGNQRRSNGRSQTDDPVVDRGLLGIVYEIVRRGRCAVRCTPGGICRGR